MLVQPVFGRRTPLADDLARDIAAHWTFETLVGSQYNDDVHGYEMFLAGAAATVTGKVGDGVTAYEGALGEPGTGYLSADVGGAGDPLDFSGRDWAFSVWVQTPDAAQNRDLLNRWPDRKDNGAQTSRQFALQYKNDIGMAHGGDGVVLTTCSDGVGVGTVSELWVPCGYPSDGSWNHIYCEGRAAAGTMGVSFNNAALVVGPSLGVFAGNALLRVGWEFTNGYSTVAVDDLRFYRRRLSVTERSAIWNGGAGYQGY
jgi:hypothetical protein